MKTRKPNTCIALGSAIAVSLTALGGTYADDNPFRIQTFTSATAVPGAKTKLSLGMCGMCGMKGGMDEEDESGGEEDRSGREGGSGKDQNGGTEGQSQSGGAMEGMDGEGQVAVKMIRDKTTLVMAHLFH